MVTHRVLFICLGNICRSPMAEGVFRRVVEEEGLMDRSNYAELKRRAPPDGRAKIHHFLDFAPQMGTKDVPDPFFGGAEGFDHALDLIEEAARGLLASLVDEEAIPAKRGA